MNSEDLNNLASAIQSIVVAISILIGGGWALYRFLSLQSIHKARAELEKLKRELRQRGTLAIQMEATAVGKFSTAKYISVLLKLTNVGSRSEIVKWSASEVCAVLVDCNEEGIPEAGSKIVGRYLSPFMSLEGATIDPGSTEEYPFLIPIKEAGVYLVDALIIGSAEETSQSRNALSAAGVNADQGGWGAAKYIEILEDQ